MGCGRAGDKEKQFPCSQGGCRQPSLACNGSAAMLNRTAMSQLYLTKIRQRFPAPLLADIEGTVTAQLAGMCAQIRPGASIAIGAGSRGIANIARVVRATAAFLRDRGAKPFIVPAMGSHGGATAEGQAALLASYGITESAMGCPVRATMDVVQLPNDGLPTRLFMDRFAWESDGVIVINRIKPHTDFHGPFESGLAKMIVIGLGKERQAFEMHSYGVHGLRDLVPKAAEQILTTGKIIGGLALVENAYDETMHIEAVPAGDILKREPEILALARENMPRLPVDDLDVLIVDQLGKNISGTGMDTNIIGRIRILGQPEPEAPRIKMIVVSDLTEESHGNATGVGFADVTTRRLQEKIDFEVTYKNVITAGFPERAKLPVVAASDREALDIALRCAGCRDVSRARVLRIRDTLHLDELLASDAVVEELRGRTNIEVAGGRTEVCAPAGPFQPL